MKKAIFVAVIIITSYCSYSQTIAKDYKEPKNVVMVSNIESTNGLAKATAVQSSIYKKLEAEVAAIKIENAALKEKFSTVEIMQRQIIELQKIIENFRTAPSLVKTPFKVSISLEDYEQYLLYIFK